MWLLIVSTVASFVVVSRATTWQQTPTLVCPCEGMSAHLPWRYTLEGNESFNLVRWYQGKPVGLQIATYQFSSNTFTPNAPYDKPGKLVFDDTTRDHSVAITMNNVTLNDTSQYSVTLQPVGDNTNGFLVVQKGDIQSCISSDFMPKTCGSPMYVAGGYNYNLTLNYTERTEGIIQTMDVTVYHDDMIIGNCTDVPEGIIPFDVPEAIGAMELIAAISLRVNGSIGYKFNKTCTVETGPFPVKPCCIDGTCVSWTRHIVAFCIGAILILIGIIIVIVLMCEKKDKRRKDEDNRCKENDNSREEEDNSRKKKDNRRSTVVMIMLAVSVLSVIVGGIIIIWFLFTENNCLKSISLVVAVVVTVLVCLLIIGVVIAVVVWWRLKGRHACSPNQVMHSDDESNNTTETEAPRSNCDDSATQPPWSVEKYH